MKFFYISKAHKSVWLSVVVAFTLTSAKGIPFPYQMTVTKAATNQPFSEHTVLAIVLPQGEAVFAVAPRKDEAVAKAVRLAETAAKQAKKDEVVAPEVLIFKTPEELFATVAADTRNMPGVHILVADKTCGQKVDRKEFACNQVGTNYAKAVFFEHYLCKSGTNGCWTVKTVAGANYYYGSRDDCETNGTPTRVESLFGYRYES